MDKKTLTKVLGRNELSELVNYHNNLSFGDKKILVTGANGSIGTDLVKKLKEMKANFLATDIEGDCKYLDITNVDNVKSTLEDYQPDIIINIAGAKHAPEGEHETWKTLSINTLGTKNLIDHAKPGAQIILTSTCKSCNPETVYGSSKLIAERMIMNVDGIIVRFFNVVETQGNVFEIWENVPSDQPIKVVSACKRYFISLSEATGLILFAAKHNKSGRYIVNSTILRQMRDIAYDLYPERTKIVVDPRRGDRVEEKFLGTHEIVGKYLLEESVIKIKNSHDK